VLKVNFQKLIWNAKIKSAKRSGFSLYSHQFTSILTERIQRQDIRVPATEKKSGQQWRMTQFL
jgi:hypothetical protein